jgi:outer membrane protein OmpA-like peptidoglycan-associated protein
MHAEPETRSGKIEPEGRAAQPKGHRRSTAKEPDMIRYLATLALAIAAAILTTHVKAETVIVYREGQQVNPQEVAAVLDNTRSIRLLDGAAEGRKSTASAAAPADSKGGVAALSLPVRFAFDSANMLPEARAQLDALAAGIKLLAPERSVTVEGHTDAAGSEAYNLELSRARARAVRDYLVQHHGIDAARLKTIGYGEGRPIEGSDPYAAINRRVQFRGS